MASPHWAAWNETRYSRKTRHFTCAAQHGIYKNLLHHQIEEGDLPGDDEELRQIARATIDEWRTYWPAIREEFFVLRRGRYRNLTAATVRGRALKGMKKQSEHGKEGARRRWERHRDEQRRASLTREPELPHLDDTRAANHTSDLPPVEAYADLAPVAKPAKRAAEKKKPKPAKPKRATSEKTRITDQWTPTPKDLEYAVSRGLARPEINAISIGFIRYWTGPDAAQRGLKIDWHRTWCNWIDKEYDHVIRRRRTSAVGSRQKTGGVVTALNSMLARRGAHDARNGDERLRSNPQESHADEADSEEGIGGWGSDATDVDAADGWGSDDKGAGAVKAADKKP